MNLVFWSYAIQYMVQMMHVGLIEYSCQMTLGLLHRHSSMVVRLMIQMHMGEYYSMNLSQFAAVLVDY
jgi:hypothetical protein